MYLVERVFSIDTLPPSVFNSGAWIFWAVCSSGGTTRFPSARLNQQEQMKTNLCIPHKERPVFMDIPDIAECIRGEIRAAGLSDI